MFSAHDFRIRDPGENTVVPDHKRRLEFYHTSVADLLFLVTYNIVGFYTDSRNVLSSEYSECPWIGPLSYRHHHAQGGQEDIRKFLFIWSANHEKAGAHQTWHL